MRDISRPADQPVAVLRRFPRARFPCGCCSAFAMFGEDESPAFRFRVCAAGIGVIVAAVGVDAAGVVAEGVDAEATGCCSGMALLCCGVPSIDDGPFCCGGGGGWWAGFDVGGFEYKVDEEAVEEELIPWSYIPPGIPGGLNRFCGPPTPFILGPEGPFAS